MRGNKSNKIVIEIFGSEYSIKSPHDNEHIKSLAQYVNEKMREVAKNTSIVSTSKIAVLAALNIADELLYIKDKDSKKKEKISDLIKKIDNYSGD